MRENLFAFALFATILPIGVAQGQPLIQSQEGIALENQILQLQSQVQQLQSGGGGNSNSSGGSALGGSAPPPEASPDGTSALPSSVITNLLTQVQQLQSQVQQLNGEVDTLQNQVNTQHDQTEKEIGDLNFKVTGSATPGAPGAPSTPGASSAPGTPATLTPPPGPAPLTPPPAQTATAAPPAPSTPHALLLDGEHAYLKGDYATAQADFQNILSNSNSSPEAYHAQYMLAKTLGAENKPQNAAIAFDDAYNRNRSGDEAPEVAAGPGQFSRRYQPERSRLRHAGLAQQPVPQPVAGTRRAHRGGGQEGELFAVSKVVLFLKKKNQKDFFNFGPSGA